MEGEYITENSALLENLLEEFCEANLSTGRKVGNSRPNGKTALKNLFMFYKNQVSSDPKYSRRANMVLEEKRKREVMLSMNIDRATVTALGNYMKQFLESDCVKEGEKLGKSRNKNLPKELEQAVGRIMRNHTQRKSLVDKAKNVTDNQKSEGTIPNDYEISSEERERLLKEGYIECENPFYDQILLEGDYQSNTKKTVKATILTIIVFILSMVITNMVRMYFGGTPGGDFASDAMKNGFLWFTTLILAPILEEPAKLISVKGGYSKHFFFTFNFLEFGLYIMMFMAGGVANLGIAILIRGLAVMMHALTTRILGTSKGKGFANTTFKLAISILLHFMFNALFMKFTLFGVGGNSLLLFAIGFFGVAFGLFVVNKLISRNSSNNYNNNFTTQGNLDYGTQGGYYYA